MMQPTTSSTETTIENEAQDLPALYRKEFLKIVLGRAQFISGKLDYACKAADGNLSIAKDMVHHMSEHFAKADIYVKHLINSPETARSGAVGFNKNVFFEFTPAKMQTMKEQLDYINDALSYGLTATNGAEFRDRTETTRKLLNESIAEMATLCGAKQTQR